MPLFSSKPTRNNRPGATRPNCCGLVVLRDKRLLSRRSGTFLLTSNSHLSALRSSLLAAASFPSYVPETQRDSLRTDHLGKCENDGERRMKARPGRRSGKNAKAPFFPHLLSAGSLLPDCRNSSRCTIANALKLVF